MPIQKTGTPVSDGIHRIFANCAVDDESEVAELMQYFKNMADENRKFPILSNRVKYFRESQKGENAISQMFKEYVQKIIEKQIKKRMTDHDKELTKIFLQNGVSAKLVRKSIPTLSPDDIEKLSDQPALTK